MGNNGMNARRKLLILLFLFSSIIATGLADAQQPRKLYLYNWSHYMKPSIIKAFEKKYNVDVVSNYYNSNSELFAKMQAGGTYQYDVIFPSDFFVPRFIKSGMLQPLNKSEIPNLDNLKPKFRNPKYDPSNKYTAAYQWVVTGLAYNTKDLPHAPNSWAILFNASTNPKYPFALLPQAQVMFAAACAYLGYDFTCTGRNKWKKAAKLILKTKKRSNFSGFVPGTRAERQLARGNIAAAGTFNGDFIHDKINDPQSYTDLKFIIPKEGAEIGVDNMAIPVHAPHPKLANKFINFILSAKIGAELSNYNDYPTPNKASQPLLKKVLQQPPITPTPVQMKRLHFIPPIKGKQLQFVQQLWTAIKSR
jgi:spermidine/putrescine transport system substrate-binding protein